MELTRSPYLRVDTDADWDGDLVVTISDGSNVHRLSPDDAIALANALIAASGNDAQR